MRKRKSDHIGGHVSALCVDEQAVDIMPDPNNGGKPIRLYANNTLWKDLVQITCDHWGKRWHTQGTFHAQGRVLLGFSIRGLE
jgi:hypothetical protein